MSFQRIATHVTCGTRTQRVGMGGALEKHGEHHLCALGRQILEEQHVVRRCDHHTRATVHESPRHGQRVSHMRRPKSRSRRRRLSEWTERVHRRIGRARGATGGGGTTTGGSSTLPCPSGIAPGIAALSFLCSARLAAVANRLPTRTRNSWHEPSTTLCRLFALLRFLFTLDPRPIRLR